MFHRPLPLCTPSAAFSRDRASSNLTRTDCGREYRKNFCEGHSCPGGCGAQPRDTLRMDPHDASKLVKKQAIRGNWQRQPEQCARQVGAEAHPRHCQRVVERRQGLEKHAQQHDACHGATVEPIQQGGRNAIVQPAQGVRSRRRRLRAPGSARPRQGIASPESGSGCPVRTAARRSTGRPAGA